MRNRGAGDERVLILFAYVFGADTGTVLDLPQTHGLPRHHHHTTPLYLCCNTTRQKAGSSSACYSLAPNDEGNDKQK